jgi:hypothetical protein
MLDVKNKVQREEDAESWTVEEILVGGNIYEDCIIVLAQADLLNCRP